MFFRDLFTSMGKIRIFISFKGYEFVTFKIDIFAFVGENTNKGESVKILIINDLQFLGCQPKN